MPYNPLTLVKIPQTQVADLFPDGGVQTVTAANIRTAFNSSQLYAVNTVTAAYTVTLADEYLRCDATGGAFTVTLPAASSCPGQLFIIKRINSGVNAVTVSRAGTDTIEGATTVSLASQWAKYQLLSLGTAWEIVGT